VFEWKTAVTVFEFRQCSNPDCGLRIPIDPKVHKGEYCPLCGAPMACAVPAYANYRPAHHPGSAENGLVVVLDNIRSGHNVGSIFRTADGVGVRHIHLCGLTPTPDKNTDISKTALGAEETIPWSYHPDATVVAQNLREKGVQLLALESTQESIALFDFKVEQTAGKVYALVVGNERAGVDPGLIKLSDAVIHLPMVGEKSSFNVSVAFGIAAYWLSHKMMVSK
jgi:tRNA G18 (ribose-2'-O)-methylase SpoU